MDSDQTKVADPNEGRMIAIKFTVDGEVPIVRRDGKDVEMGIPEEEFRGPPKGWKQKHSEGMWKLHECMEQVRALERRQIPLLRDEAVSVGIPKSVLKDLEAFGMVRHRLLKILDRSRGGKPTGGRMVVYFTPQGHAYVREALKKETQDETVQSAGEAE